MMIIAESGSTKTDWIILKDGQIRKSFATPGFNPNYFEPRVLQRNIDEVSQRLELAGVDNVFFYGSGCSSEYSKEIVGNIILKNFPQADVEVNSDLFGAGRALFGHGKGIAAVLGTGSSSCLFDAGKILEVVPSLGYLLADEGSGFQIGKKLLKAAFNHEFPQHLQKQFDAEYSLDFRSFIKTLYDNENPNSVIASFTPFAVKNCDEPFVIEMLRNIFEDFFSENVIKYSNYRQYTLGFAGSVAFLFKDELEFVARRFDLSIQKIIKNPIEELVNFHSVRTG